MHDDADYSAAYTHVRLSEHARRALVALAAVCALLGSLLTVAAAPASAADDDARGAAPGTSHRGAEPRGLGPVRVPHGSLAAGTASISGHVDLAPGSPGWWYDRVVMVTNGSYTRYGYVNSSTGHYSVSNLPAGSYRVEFNRLSGYAYSEAEFYDDHAEYQGPGSADLVTVAAGQARTGIDAALVKGGSISGKLVDGTGNTLSWCRLQAYTDDGHLVTRNTESNWDGTFTIPGLTTGAYKVRVLASRWSECDGGTQYVVGTGGPASTDPAAATPVNVVRGVDKAITSNVVYKPGGRITGHVTLPPDARSLDRYVVARNLANGAVKRTAKVSRDDGTYTITGLPAGSYRVTFARVSGMALSQAEFYNDHAESAGLGSADRIDVALGQTRAAVSATLTKGGSISGHLVDGAGDDLAGCYVQAFTPDGSLVTRAAYTGPDGTFSVSGLSTGSYRLRVVKRHDSACNRTPQLYNGTGQLGGPASATAIPVSVGVDHPIAGDLVYEVGGTIAGHVDLPADAEGHDRVVVVRKVNTHRTRSARVNRDGDYSVAGLEAGTYRVTFARVSGFALAAAQFFDGHDESEGVGSADQVVVGSGATVTANATLTEGGHLTGTLTDTHGKYLHCLVQAYTTDGSLVTRTGLSLASASGAFDIGGLTTGDYYLRVVPSYYNGCRSGIQYALAGGGPLTATGPGAGFHVTQGDTTVVTQPLQYTRVVPVRSWSAPVVSGTPRVGSALTASNGTWSQTGLAFAYQWRADGVAIGGATGQVFTPTSTELGKKISVKVTASKAGFGNGSRVSAPVGPVVAAPVVTPPPPAPPAAPGLLSLLHKPSFKGTPRAGQKLTAVAGATSPSAGSVTYQWLLNGKAVKRATKATYKLSKSDVGKKISLQVTYVRSGYTTLVSTSSAKKVKAAKKKH